jgi:hypothetical protein
MTLSRVFVRVKAARSDVARESLPQIEGCDEPISNLEKRAGQHWRLENLKCFDEFLEERAPCLWHAHIATYPVLLHLINDDLRRPPGTVYVKENWFVNGAVTLFGSFVIHDES